MWLKKFEKKLDEVEKTNATLLKYGIKRVIKTNTLL